MEATISVVKYTHLGSENPLINHETHSNHICRWPPYFTIGRNESLHKLFCIENFTVSIPTSQRFHMSNSMYYDNMTNACNIYNKFVV